MAAAATASTPITLTTTIRCRIRVAPRVVTIRDADGVSLIEGDQLVKPLVV
jgi:hypothetical protein